MLASKSREQAAFPEMASNKFGNHNLYVVHLNL
jgi:hypothetical protein